MSSSDCGSAAYVVEVRGLEKSYGGVAAVRGLDFTIPAGQVVGFLGPNGAGKTTVMKILTGFVAADSGAVRVCGHDVETEALRVKERVGYLPENNPLYTEMRVGDFLKFACQARGLHGAKARTALERVVDGTGIEAVYGRTIGECSKGYRQRTGLAQALLHDPPLLLLDEPTNGLDPNQVVEIHALIRALGRTKTVVLTSHVLPEVEAMAERVILIAQGRKVADAPLAELVQGAGRPRLRVSVRGSGAALDSTLQSAGVEVVEAAQATDAAGIVSAVVAVDDAHEGAASVSAACATGGLALVELVAEGRTLESMFRMLTGEGSAA